MRAGGQILIDQLVAQGVERVYCVPGESYLAALDAMNNAPIELTVCRQEAGDSDIGSMRDKCREPTGSPEERYESTMLRKISRERAFSVVNALVSAGRSVGADMRQEWLELTSCARRGAFWARD